MHVSMFRFILFLQSSFLLTVGLNVRLLQYLKIFKNSSLFSHWLHVLYINVIYCSHVIFHIIGCTHVIFHITGCSYLELARVGTMEHVCRRLRTLC